MDGNIDNAYQGLIEFGVVGAVLAIVLFCAIGLVWWTLKTTARTIREKDQLLAEVQEKRFQAAQEATTMLTRVSEQLQTLTRLMESILREEDKHDPPTA